MPAVSSSSFIHLVVIRLTQYANFISLRSSVVFYLHPEYIGLSYVKEAKNYSLYETFTERNAVVIFLLL